MDAYWKMTDLYVFLKKLLTFLYKCDIISDVKGYELIKISQRVVI